MTTEELFISICEQHNKSFFLSALRASLQNMRRTFKKIPIVSILENFSEVENFFNKKTYLKPDKFWGYSIGRAENGREIKHENTNPSEGPYLTIFRIHRKKLLFEFYRISRDGVVEENIIDKMALDFKSIDELIINRSSMASARYLRIRTSAFSTNLTLQPYNANYSEYYKATLENIMTEIKEENETVDIKIDSDYIRKKIDSIRKSSESDQIIGDSKDLIESICKTILKKKSIIFESDWKIARFIKECNKLIRFDIDGLENQEKVERSLKQILQGIGTTIQGIAEIRNELGTGHGRDSEFTKIKNIYAKLISTQSIELSRFYLDHFNSEFN